MNKLTEKEKNKLVFDAIESIDKVIRLRGLTFDSLSAQFRAMMIDCYIEGAKRVLEEIK